MTHSFQRYTGAGNTFVVMDTLQDPLSLGKDEMELLVRKVTDHMVGVGADGVILINGSSTAPFRMDFYNPDGSTGMLCGNGARCAVQAAKDYGLVSSATTEFEVLGATNSAELLPGGNVRVHFQDPRTVRRDISLTLDGVTLTVHYVDVGSQHIVLFADELAKLGGSIEEFDIAKIGSALRWHPDFQPLGANANFIEVREDGEEKYLRIRTFERGVEAETLACGTGCMSSAIVAAITGAITTLPIRLLTQSGEFVTVNFQRTGDAISELTLEGSAIRGEEGTILFDELTGDLQIEYATDVRD